MLLNEQILEKIKSLILKKATPIKIILFGSVARGNMTTDSDIDLMIIVHEHVDKFDAAWSIYPLLTNLGVGVDLVIVHEHELESKRDDKNLIYYSALRDGIEIYAA